MFNNGEGIIRKSTFPMKTFDEIKNNVEPDELNEGRLIRKGTAILLAKNARMHGN